MLLQHQWRNNEQTSSCELWLFYWHKREQGNSLLLLGHTHGATTATGGLGVLTAHAQTGREERGSQTCTFKNRTITSQTTDWLQKSGIHVRWSSGHQKLYSRDGQYGLQCTSPYHFEAQTITVYIMMDLFFCISIRLVYLTRIWMAGFFLEKIHKGENIHGEGAERLRISQPTWWRQRRGGTTSMGVRWNRTFVPLLTNILQRFL